MTMEEHYEARQDAESELLRVDGDLRTTVQGQTRPFERPHQKCKYLTRGGQERINVRMNLAESWKSALKPKRFLKSRDVN